MHTPESTPATKQSLRSRVYGQRRRRWPAAAPSGARGQVAEAIAHHGLQLARAHVPAGGRVVSFVSMGTEPPTEALNEALTEAGFEVIVPVTLDDMDLDWMLVGAGLPAAVRRAELTSEHAARLLGPDAVTGLPLLLVPGVAVDATGTRLGRGGGSYDRSLARARVGAQVVVILHSDEVLDEAIPVDPHDHPVTGVLTPEGFRRLGGRS